MTLRHPVPKSIVTYSSSIIGISLLIKGINNFLPFRWVYLGSLGLIHTAASAIMVSGRVVAMTAYSVSEGFPLSEIIYLR